MKLALAIGSVIALGSAASTLHAQESTFKAYGFADARMTSMFYEDNNFLRIYGTLYPHTQFYLDHVNTYFDWKPNANVRVLAEVALNRDGWQNFQAGLKAGIDSASVYSSAFSGIYSQTLAGLMANPALSSLPASVINHMADSIAQATTSSTVHGMVLAIRSRAPISEPIADPKDHGISLPRVHTDILVRDELSFRVGKFITPAGIWNVDHGSPAIMTVRQPYQTSLFRIFPESQTGVQAFGKSSIGDNDLSYAGWVTTGRGGLSVFNDYDYGQAPQNIDDWAWGTHLQTDLAYLDGIRLGGSFHTGTIRESAEYKIIPVVSLDLSTNPPATNTDFAKMTGERKTTAYSRELCYGLDAKIQWNKFLLQAEWNHLKQLNLLNDSKETDVDAWYVLASRTFPVNKTMDLSPYAMYETIGWTDPGNNPAGLEILPFNGFGTIVTGLNIGLYSRIHLKLEYSHVSIEARRFATGSTANTYSDSDLGYDQLDAQFSVAF